MLQEAGREPSAKDRLCSDVLKGFTPQAHEKRQKEKDTLCLEGMGALHFRLRSLALVFRLVIVQAGGCGSWKGWGWGFKQDSDRQPAVSLLPLLGLLGDSQKNV